MECLQRLGYTGTFVLLLVAGACSATEQGVTVPPSTSASTRKSEGSGPALDRGTAFFTLGEHEIVINYGRPSLQGRDMLSELEPGSVWRLGMNEATELETISALNFGEQQIPAGRYTIFAKYLGDKSWHLVFNKQLGQWGAFEYDPGQDAGEVPLSVEDSDTNIDRLTISVETLSDDQGRLVFSWGKLRLLADFRLS